MFLKGLSYSKVAVRPVIICCLHIHWSVGEREREKERGDYLRV